MAAPNDSVIRLDGLLLATDGSEDAMLAARVATDLSQRTGARLHVVHAWYHLVKGLGYYCRVHRADGQRSRPPRKALRRRFPGGAAC